MNTDAKCTWPAHAVICVHLCYLWLASAALAQSQPTSAPGSRPAATQPAQEAWTMFRGDPSNTGVARSALPEKLELRWKFATPKSEPFEAAPAIADGVVYIGCDDASLYAIELATGKERWKYAARDAIKSSPCVYNETIYFGDDAGVLHALAARDGGLRWKFEAGESIISSPLPYGGRIIFGSYNGSLYCLSAADGKQVWKYDTEDKVHAAPTITDDAVLISGCDTKLHVVKLADGTLLRKVDLGAPCGAAAAVLGEMAFAGTQGSQVVGLNWKTGEHLWLFEDKDKQLPYLASAAVADGLVILGGRDKRIRAFEAKSGELRWNIGSASRIESSAVVVGKRVFVPTGDGTLLELDVGTGTERWKYEAGGGFVGSPAVGEGFLVIGSVDGVVYCFGKK